MSFIEINFNNLEYLNIELKVKMNKDLDQNYKAVFNKKLGFGNNLAIILVDFVDAYFDKNSPLYADVEEVLSSAIRIRNKGRETRIDEFNKKHGTNFKNELELNYFVATKLDKKEKEIDRENQSNISKNEDNEISKDDDIGGSLKRLKKMYNDGHLTKVEFEKAKNKLLK